MLRGDGGAPLIKFINSLQGKGKKRRAGKGKNRERKLWRRRIPRIWSELVGGNNGSLEIGLSISSRLLDLSRRYSFLLPPSLSVLLLELRSTLQLFSSHASNYVFQLPCKLSLLKPFLLPSPFLSPFLSLSLSLSLSRVLFLLSFLELSRTIMSFLELSWAFSSFLSFLELS